MLNTYQSCLPNGCRNCTKKAFKAITAICFLSISLENIFSTKLPVLVNSVLNQRTSVGFLYGSLILIFLKGLFTSLHVLVKGRVSTFINPHFLVPRTEGDNLPFSSFDHCSQSCCLQEK